MFQKEKMINGVLHYRNTPQDEFKPYTIEQLSKMYNDLDIESSDAFHKLFLIKEFDEEKILKESSYRELEGADPLSFAGGARWVLRHFGELN